MVAAQDNAIKHFSQVSLRDQLTGQQGRKEIRPDFELARKHNIAIVRLANGFDVPAAIGLRTTVTKQTVSLTRVTDHWHVTISPFDEALLRRLHAKRNPRNREGKESVDILDAPLPGAFEARYDAVERIKKAHEPLCDLCPTEWTVIDVTLAITRDLARVPSFQASSTNLLRQQVTRAFNHNLRANQKFAAAHWPFSGPVSLMGYRLYPWWDVELIHLMNEPLIPEYDPWESGGEHLERLGEVVAHEFLPVLESLWKAVFAQDGDRGGAGKVAAQLRSAGYQLDNLEATRIGIGPLRELMQANRKLGNLTMMGSPDLLDELGAEHFVRLT